MVEGGTASYDKAIQLNPQDSTAYNNRGAVHEKMDNLEQAIRDYSTAITLDPLNATAYMNRGIAYGQTADRTVGSPLPAIGGPMVVTTAYWPPGDPCQRAVADLTSALQLNPGDAKAYYNRAGLSASRTDARSRD